MSNHRNPHSFVARTSPTTLPIPICAGLLILCVLLSGCGTVGNTTLSPTGTFHANAAWTAIWPSSTQLQPGTCIHVEPVSDTVYEAYADKPIVIPVRITIPDPSVATNRDFWVYSCYSVYRQADFASPQQQAPIPLAVATPWPKPDGKTPQVFGGGLWERRVVHVPINTNQVVAHVEVKSQHTPPVTISGGLVEIGSCFVYLTDHCQYRPNSILSNILTVRFIRWK